MPLYWANGNVSCSLATTWQTNLNKKNFPPWTGAFLEKQWFPLNDTLFFDKWHLLPVVWKKFSLRGWLDFASFHVYESGISHTTQKTKNIPCVSDREVWGTNLGVVGESQWGFVKTLLWTEPMTRRGCIFSHAFLKYLLHTVAEAAVSLLAKAQAVSKGCCSMAAAGSWGPALRCWTTLAALTLFPD